MISLFGCPISCGLVLLGGTMYYSSAEAFMKDLVAVMSPKNAFTQFVYSHKITGKDIGRPLMEYIRENNLGIVVESAPGANPVHDSAETGITVWTWTRDLDGWDVWLKKHGLQQGQRGNYDHSHEIGDHSGGRTAGINKDLLGYVPYNLQAYRQRASKILEKGAEAFTPKE